MFGFFSKKKKTAVAPKQAVTEIEKITAKEILSALNQMQKELDDLYKAKAALSSENREMMKKNSVADEEIASLKREKDNLTKEIEELKRQCEQLQRQSP